MMGEQMGGVAAMGGPTTGLLRTPSVRTPAVAPTHEHRP